MKRLIYLINGLVFAPKTRPFRLPRKIGRYSLVRSLGREAHRPFSVGIYRHPSKKFVLAKIWVGKHKNLHYWSLRREQINSQVFTQIGVKCFPRFIDSIEEEGRYVLMLEYVPGRRLSAYPVTYQDRFFSSCLKQLKIITGLLTPAQRKLISVRGAGYFLLLYPVILLIVLVRHPRQVSYLLGTIPVFAGGIAFFFKKAELYLVHGDLHPKNVLVHGKSPCIFDTEQSMITYPEFEIVTSMASKHLHPSLRRRLADKAAASPSFPLYRSLAVFCSLYDLTSHAPAENMRSYSRLLNWAINPNHSL